MQRVQDSSRFLGRVKPNAYRRARRGAHLGTDSPRVKGTIQAYTSTLPEEQRQLGRAALFNPVKVCPSCGKPNGHTLQRCNKCRRSLLSVRLSETPNLFTGFLLGVESGGRFPLRISLRSEDDETMVFDDPLSLAPLHFCAVPTKLILPDWRFLTLQPERGLEIHQRLLTACHDAARRDFFDDAAWCASLLRVPAAANWEWHMIAGYNYPPSQNQLHIQYMSPALMPHQHMMFLRGVHFTHMRFFPVDYVVACLQRLVTDRQCCTHAELQLPIEDFVALLERRCGVAYTPLHAALLENVAVSYALWNNWKPEKFEGEYVCADAAGGTDGRAVFHPFHLTASAVEAAPEAQTEQAVFEQEKKSLENYGVSINPVDRPLGFYAFSKALSELDVSFLAP
ncbi:hypothetical protein ABB37_09212 [Leptomonas pyrrhocoris]|uniref:Uncharacterized protein n=1 Tax=Leptomonas pyrrhocoris TaxID=157538 RepID=A0A0M9FRQ4_LEPPY|nr:hypothetical protein ABB37_09212 [Leptomonas pyrrhocoris]XP_015653018.1 hypothetical protein ABB37_09212 [Leptomonas pyrrhocoris]KPA74578.1 hypothetical protein ABB37_09212 [Leptomonas pyrrhocoris]KPA74579.1 hypothetical protein ABB37_09212 [Leptomonas pyrrhocoris]|eukprot:XP_015653017.1 hypothetical protein ABB37_09212 [Leptomonas pyrrhocoris]